MNPHTKRALTPKFGGEGRTHISYFGAKGASAHYGVGVKGPEALLLVAILFFFPVLGFAQLLPIERGVSVTVTVPTSEEEERPGGGGPAPIPGKVVFEGRAYPNAFLTLLKDNRVAATFFAENSGLFEKELTGVPGGRYSFGIFAEDTEGRKSVTLSFTISILRGTTTTISGIFISPTISLSPVQVEKGQKVDIFGQVFPESQVNIFIFPEEITQETIANLQGKWAFELDTGFLKEGEHNVRAKAFFGDGEQSPFSQTIPFSVLPSKCQGADLNFDGKINLVDFSILLYFWHSTSPENICADINQDGIVNIVDFSIMMFFWTE